MTDDASNNNIVSVKPDEDILAFRDELVNFIADRAGKVPADQLLAMLAHTVGAAIAWQDQRSMSPDMAMDLVHRNIVQGNADAIAALEEAPAAPGSH